MTINLALGLFLFFIIFAKASSEKLEKKRLYYFLLAQIWIGCLFVFLNKDAEKIFYAIWGVSILKLVVFIFVMINAKYKVTSNIEE